MFRPFYQPFIFILLFFTTCAFIPKISNIQQTSIRNEVASKVFEIKGIKDGGGGTGFQVEAPHGVYIVTNSHVCEYAIKDGEDKNFVLVEKNDHLMKRRILEISDRADLCIIEGWPGMTGLSIGDESKVGDRVAAVGHPHLGPTTMTIGEVTASANVIIEHHVMTTGDEKIDALISASKESCDNPKNSIQKKVFMLFNFLSLGEVPVCLVNETNAIQTNITIYPGSSGSPLISTSSGKVVGVMFASDPSTNWGFAVNLNNLRYFLKDF